MPEYQSSICLTRFSVRSFDNKDPSSIRFYTPLTLIVGQNGSGKTTIIECLKYATTGELPPNSRGGAFIHDPKICRDNPVKAQVKLQFHPTTERERKMVVARSLELTVKRTARTQRTLEGSLALVDAKKDERLVVSKTVAEMDRFVPQYMGVSPAILENVIFCHQDECLWPLSEPAALKKKFDAIFEAEKYTKAVDNIKQIRKKQNEELGKFKISEQHAKEDKTKADKAEKRSRELQKEIEALREQTIELHRKAKEAGDNATEAWDHVANFTQVIETLKAGRKNKEWLENQLKNLKTNLKVRPEPDDVLEAELSQFEERMKTHQTRESQQVNKYKDLDRDIRRVQGNRSQKVMEVGKHEQQKVTHEQKVKDREQTIKRSAQEHGIRGYDMDLDDMQISEYMERIMKLSKDQNSKIERLRRDNATEIQKIQEVLESLREQGSALREGKKAAKDQVTNNDRRIATYHSELGRISADEAGKASIEARIEELETRLRNAKQEMSSGDTESKIGDVNRSLQKLEGEATALNRELVQGTKRAGELARLDHLKKESKDRQRSIETMTDAHGDRLRELIGDDWQLETLDKAYRQVSDKEKQRVTEAERKRDGAARELEQMQFKLRSAKVEMKKKEESLESCANRLRDDTSADPEEYPDVLEEAQNNRDVRNADVDNFKNMRKYFSEAIEHARSDKHACRLCTRSFEDDREINRFVTRLEKQLSQAAYAGMQEELKEFEATLKKVKDAGISYDTWARLSEKEIPVLRTEIKQLDQEHERLVRQVEQHDNAVADLKDVARDAEDLAKPVETITKCFAEQKSYDAQVREVSSKKQDANASRSLEDVQDILEANAVEMKGLRNKLTKLQGDDRQKREEISTLGLELGSAKGKLMTASHELDKKATIQKQIGELRDSNQEQRGTVANLDSRIQELDPRLSEHRAKLEDMRQRGQARETELQKEATSLNDTVRTLVRADEEIRVYLENGGSNRLNQCRREIESFDQEIKALEAEQRQVTVEINKIKEELNNQDRTKRVIDDNLQFRKVQRDLQAVEREIAELLAQNAEHDQEQYRLEAQRWQREHNLAATDETSKMGTMKAKDDLLEQLLRDWNTDFADAAAKYKRAHIEVETTKAAVEDLARYGGALDQAIMRYHSLKMEEINRLLQELWQKTYQGSDVDGIRIRSESEAVAASGGRGNRSYNYRVVMVKQDVEMDMRGRCSAGQKVLASILIRLALAECFGQNCGLIALDEPTTNLDRENIGALAKSLHGLIKDRMQQRNFQLVVITHDEDFLRQMRCQDFCDQYWRVSRNDKQKSIIERQSIAEVLYN